MARRKNPLQPVVGVSLLGGKALQEALHGMREDVQGTYLLHAVQRGGEITRNVAEQLAPRSEGGSHGNAPGYLASKVVMVDTAAEPTFAQVGVGVDRAAFYGWFQELGTVHQPAQPFLRPASDETEDDVVDQVAETLSALIDSELNKLLQETP